LCLLSLLHQMPERVAFCECGTERGIADEE
jgi:hypothetical protein